MLKIEHTKQIFYFTATFTAMRITLLCLMLYMLYLKIKKNKPNPLETIPYMIIMC